MGPMELLLIVVLALIVFGPAKLPEIMGQIGKAINDFRRATSDLSDEFNKTIQAELQETKAVVDEARSAVTDARSAVSDVHTSVNSAVTGLPAPVRVAEPGEVVGISTPNGVSGEPHAETNGTASPDTKPPLADTAQWSWETSGPKTPVAETPATEATSTEPTAEIVEPVMPASPAPPASPPSQERIAPDELLPPY